ncbi:MAG: acyl carrier protein [Pseudomonadota bacterium]
MTTLAKLQDILVNDYRVSRDQLSPDAALTAIGLDSLSTLELMFKIEDVFQVTIVDDTPPGIVTVADVVTYIDSLLLRKSASTSGAQLSNTSNE